MGKPVAGDVIVVPFPQTNLQIGKRRPALVVADLPGDDLIACQITSRTHSDNYCVSLKASDFQTGQLAVESIARVNRLFTMEQSVVLYIAARISAAKLAEIRGKLRQLFS